MNSLIGSIECLIRYPRPRLQSSTTAIYFPSVVCMKSYLALEASLTPSALLLGSYSRYTRYLSRTTVVLHLLRVQNKTIGSGGYGVVVSALDKKKDTKVAVKKVSYRILRYVGMSICRHLYMSIFRNIDVFMRRIVALGQSLRDSRRVRVI